MVSGIHHVSGIARHAQRNLDFYAGVLGLRLVKLTVDHEDPSLYHMFYGDAVGSPGTVVSFVAKPAAPNAVLGDGYASVLAFMVPMDSLPYWRQQLSGNAVPFWDARDESNEHKIGLRDPDGLYLELVATSSTMTETPWHGNLTPRDSAIRGIHGVRVLSSDAMELIRLLNVLGFQHLAGVGPAQRYFIGAGGRQQFITLVQNDVLPVGRHGVGEIDHVAFGVPDGAVQMSATTALNHGGFAAGDFASRQYYSCVPIVRERGVGLEVVTDGPGFTIDEDVDHLGSHLVLPRSVEPYRERIERTLPSLSFSWR